MQRALADHADLVQLLSVIALHMRNQLHGVCECLGAVRAALRSAWHATTSPPTSSPVHALLKLQK